MYLQTNPTPVPGLLQTARTCKVICRSCRTVKPNKAGIKTIRYACEFERSHGCKVWFKIEQDPAQDQQHELFHEEGVEHDHSTYIGRQTHRDFRNRVEALAAVLVPRKIRRQLTAEGMLIDDALYNKLKGIQYRFLVKQFGAQTRHALYTTDPSRLRHHRPATP